MTASQPSDATEHQPPATPATHSRRSLLRLAAAGAGGAAAASLVAQPAAAAAGTWQIGSEGNATNTLTKSIYTGASNGDPIPDGNAAFEFHSGSGYAGLVRGSESVMAVIAGTDSLIQNALLATTHRYRATAVIATATSDESVGVQTESQGDDGVGLVAVASQGIGAIIRGGTANMRLPSLTGSRPAATTGGELLHDSQGQLWFNAQPTGSPGTAWRLLSSPLASGSFTPISPTRVYDSRRGTAPIGALQVGQSRTLDANVRRDVTSGEVINTGLLFDTAVAVALTITVVSTVGRGFLTVNAGTATAVAGSSVNWYANGQTVANSTTCGLNYLNQLTVVCGGSPGASTHFVIDITGIYR